MRRNGEGRGGSTEVEEMAVMTRGVAGSSSGVGSRRRRRSPMMGAGEVGVGARLVVMEELSREEGERGTTEEQQAAVVV